MSAHQTAERLRPFGTSIFSEMTRLALAHGAVNLAQGFPDFDPDPPLVDAARAALDGGHHQYAPAVGAPVLRAAVAQAERERFGMEWDPATEVAVFPGATGAIAAFLLGTLDPGDEVLLLEPFYDSYPAICALAGAAVRTVRLEFPQFRIDPDRLAAAVTPRTRVLVLNNPHNPTGRVFDRDELQAVADVCVRHDLLVLEDAVYEHLVFDGARHTPLASLPGMRERTFSVRSAGKTFSATGWKIGWGLGPAPLVQAAVAAQQFLSFSVTTPLQHAVAAVLPRTHEFVTPLCAHLVRQRDRLVEALLRVGMDVAPAAASYFAVARIDGVWNRGNDGDFARFLTSEVGVACIPTSAFYASPLPTDAPRIVRFAFCKRAATMDEAIRRLDRLPEVLRRTGG